MRCFWIIIIIIIINVINIGVNVIMSNVSFKRNENESCKTEAGFWYKYFEMLALSPNDCDIFIQ